MNYNVHKLDRRYSHHTRFSHYIGFSNRMNIKQGPLDFCQAQKWFTETYGWSAEVQIYQNIYEWFSIASTVPMMRVPGGWVRQEPKDLPEFCNPSWSWTNGYDDLRIYVASEKELAFFQLAHPQEST